MQNSDANMQTGHTESNPTHIEAVSPQVALPDSSHHDRADRRWVPRFGIRSLMLIMLVAGVMSACLSYLVKALLHGAEFKVVFVSLTVAAPTLLLVAVSTLAWALRSVPTRDRR